MNTIVTLQREKFDKLFEKLEYLSLNLEKAYEEMNEESIKNLVDKLRLFNNNIDNLDSEANSILIDIKDNISLINDDMNNILLEEIEQKKMIKDFYPLFLLYMLNNKPNFNIENNNLWNLD